MKWYAKGEPFANRLSLPSRGAWIEIGIAAGETVIIDVAPLAGSVD